MSQELKIEAENPNESGPSVVDREKTNTEESEDQMESSENEDSEDDSDNPDDYHPVIFLDEPDDPYHEPTDVGYLVIINNLLTMDLERKSRTLKRTAMVLINVLKLPVNILQGGEIICEDIIKSMARNNTSVNYAPRNSLKEKVV